MFWDGKRWVEERVWRLRSSGLFVRVGALPEKRLPSRWRSWVGELLRSLIIAVAVSFARAGPAAPPTITPATPTGLPTAAPTMGPTPTPAPDPTGDPTPNPLPMPTVDPLSGCLLTLGRSRTKRARAIYRVDTTCAPAPGLGSRARAMRHARPCTAEPNGASPNDVNARVDAG